MEMKTRVCPVCGNVFVPNSSTHKYCSPKCKGKMKSKQMKLWHEKEKQRNQIIKKCKICGKEFEKTVQYRIYCSDECKAAGLAEISRKYCEKKKVHTPPPPQPDTTKCKTCIYSAIVSGGITCDYILIMGEPRGCPGGKDCDKYVARRKKRTSKQITYSAKRKEALNERNKSNRD